ncbi:MAG TPA: hypothetical protein VJ144_03625, partial [Candidatus Polarisedimenticolia bacterium]|nr:hypothetical protein [Candidatus Polarisedimenticolia bacterium]
MLRVAPATTTTTPPAAPPVLRLRRISPPGGSTILGRRGERLGAWTLRRGRALARFALRPFG